MTCCGFVIRGDDGYLWGDGEQYLFGQPTTDPMEKTATSPGGLAAVATGQVVLCEQVRRLVAGLGLAPFSDALRRLPRELREACAEERAHCREIEAPDPVHLSCGLIGPGEGEMRGAVFAEATNFEPRLASAWLSPNVGGAPEDGAGSPQRRPTPIAICQEPLPGRDGEDVHHRPRRADGDRQAIGPVAHRR